MHQYLSVLPPVPVYNTSKAKIRLFPLQNTGQKMTENFLLTNGFFFYTTITLKVSSQIKVCHKLSKACFIKVNAQLYAHKDISACIDLTQTKCQAFINTHTQSSKISKQD